MKILPKIIALTAGMLMFTFPAVAQGTFQFQFSPSGASENPPSQSSMSAVGTEASLSPSSLFSASLALTDFSRITGVFIVNGTDPGNDLLQFAPGGIAVGQDGQPSTRQFTLQTTLNQNLVADLKSGLWYVNVTTPSFPNGEIRGQIISVPEPSTMALLGFALVAAAVVTHSRVVAGS